MKEKAKQAQSAGLTHKQYQVLLWIAEGMTNKWICAELGRSEAGGRYITARMCKRLGARTPAHAVAIGMRRGIIK